MTEVARVIAVAEVCGEFSHVAFADWLTTQRAETFCTRSSPIHQYESHVRLHRVRTAWRSVANMAPTQRQAKERTKLQQGFFRAITSVQNSGDDKKPAENVEIKGSDIVAIMLSSSVDMVAFLEDFRRMMISGVCKIEGREVLTSALYDKLDPDDIDSLLGEYLGNFILSSRLKTLQKR